MTINIGKEKESDRYGISVFGIESIGEVTALKEIEGLLRSMLEKLNGGEAGNTEPYRVAVHGTASVTGFTPESV
ncbi:MAG: hypothetical protein PUB21_11605 [Bacteroidales bacterium]|nr:hypothetical protein [Bacteroidales bacterium]